MTSLRIVLAVVVALSASLGGGCAATVESQEHCTPQWPPGPCTDGMAPPSSKS